MDYNLFRFVVFEDFGVFREINPREIQNFPSEKFNQRKKSETCYSRN